MKFYDEPPTSPEKPRQRKGTIFTYEVEEELESNSGKWAVIHVADSNAMATIWRQRHGERGFEFQSHRLEDGRFEIWARYNIEADGRALS